MSILCTFPGRFGDLLWALPTVRAISEALGEPVDLLICGEFASLIPLLDQQSYLARVVADPDWGMSHGWQPPGRDTVISPYAATYHLGYRGWPTRPLPLEIAATAITAGADVVPDLSRPWIHVPLLPKTPPLAIGFSDCWFELKVGLIELLQRAAHQRGFLAYVLPPPGSRWETEMGFDPIAWQDAAQAIAGATVFFGDCSALHVLAVALGTPVVLCEPMEARWDPIFFPLGTDGPEVTLVKGLDGRPTFDARHCGDALEAALGH